MYAPLGIEAIALHKPALVTLAVILVGFLTACSGANILPPTAPSTPLSPVTPAPAPNPAGAALGNGTIAIRELIPGSGATLILGDCPFGPANRRCAGPWSGTFDVLVDRDMTYAVLTVWFYNGQTICGYGANTADIVPRWDACVIHHSSDLRVRRIQHVRTTLQVPYEDNAPRRRTLVRLEQLEQHPDSGTAGHLHISKSLMISVPGTTTSVAHRRC
jgi:hypothetical protein